MHPAAMEWVAEQVQAYGPFGSVIEIGARDVNGSVRGLFDGADYTGIDIDDGPGVDVVIDAADYEPERKVDCVVCCETLEHAPNWRELVAASAGWLAEDGVLIITCAGPGRRPHSAIDGSYNVRAHEHYANVSIEELAEATELTMLRGRAWGEDTQAVARNA